MGVRGGETDGTSVVRLGERRERVRWADCDLVVG